jgi:PAS domain S-box-containing protein
MSEAARSRTPDVGLFRDVFNASPIGIAVENLEGQPLFVNPAFCSFLGFSEEELHHKHCVDFSPPEDAQKDWALFQQLKAGSIDQYQLDKRYFRKDGSLVWGRLSISLLKSGASPLVIAMVQDITEEHRAQEARFRHAAIVESSDDAIVGLDTNGTITDWNKGAERLFGYSASEAIGENILFLSQADAQKNGEGLLKKVWQGEVVRHHETVRRRKDGTSVDISLTLSPIVDVEGQIVGASGIARDISERKRAEGRLREYEEVVEVLGDRIIVVDREYRYVIANAAFLKYRGFEKEQVIGHTVAEILGKETFEADIKQQFDECFQGKVVRNEVKYSYPDLGERNISAAYFPIRGPLGIDRVACVLRDITESVAVEEALRESEEQFRTLAEAMPQLCWMAHGDGHIFWYNQRWYTYTGTTLEQMEGWGWQSVHDPQALPLVLERWKTSIATGEPFDMVFPLKAADGIFHPFLTRITPVKNSKGSVVRWFGTNTDVTELRNAQEALSEMTRKLVQAQEQERARIARELHDDISQRLAMLAIELEQLQDNPSEVWSRVQELRKRTTELSNDVQGLSHDLHSSQLEYLGVVAGMKSWCKEFGERQGLQIDCRHDVRSTLPRDTGLCLFRVLQEALHNAAKHSGVKRIEVQLREDSGEIHLFIIDLGRGFDWETAMLGRGLGLTSMQERVRLINGTIQIQSKPMSGTTVHVRVPLSPGSDSTRAAG